ncbi:hypothetical protein KP509_06G075900 [Ceratopteris richardii]|uniref:Major facilitator superfamily (MFS) profile domain-containing protein n=1 Tax=Ceratopteris richardii TaxID=49495 RepID=A0A8T2UJU6_CERRI|nr:hypothetical protein KP509_06G075900 [Ceratopteris richardii]
MQTMDNVNEDGGLSISMKAKKFWSGMRRNSFLLQLASSAGLGGLLFGYDTGVISSALLYIREDFPAVKSNALLQETIVSMVLAGATVGAAIGGTSCDKFGRKKAIIGSDIIFFIGAVVMASAIAPWMLIIGRVLVGISVGVASVASPLYIAEASPSKYRGALISLNSLWIAAGQFLAIAVNAGLTQVPGTWRWMLGVASVPSIVQFVMMMLLPESPRWLYKHNHADKAYDILRRIYSEDDIDREMEDLKIIDSNEQTIEASFTQSWWTRTCRRTVQVLRDLLFNKNLRLALIAGAGLLTFQKFSGINCVMYYSPTIVQMAGFRSNTMAIFLSLGIAAINVIGTLVGMYLIERLGRRPLVILSLIGVLVSLGVLTLAFFKAVGWAAVLGLGIYIMAFSPGMAGIGATCCWASNLIINMTFLSLTSSIGPAFTFIVFICIVIVAILFVFVFVPETKGLTFEEVEKMCMCHAGNNLVTDISSHEEAKHETTRTSISSLEIV